MSRLKPRPTSPLRDTAITADRIVDRSVTGVKQGTVARGRVRQREPGVLGSIGQGDYRRAQESAGESSPDRALSEPARARRHRSWSTAPSISPRPERPEPPPAACFFCDGNIQRTLHGCALPGRVTPQPGLTVVGPCWDRAKNGKGGRCGPPLTSWSPEPGSSRGSIRPPREANFLCLACYGASRVPGGCESPKTIQSHESKRLRWRRSGTGRGFRRRSLQNPTE